MELSKIGWTDHTFNPWTGCTKVSDGCANCYAEQWSKKTEGRVQWGPGKPRIRTQPPSWAKVLKWDREGASRPTDTPRPRVFTASLADWLDDEAPILYLADLLDLVRRTENLTWLLLTKRPQNFATRLSKAAEYCADFGDFATHAFILKWLNGWTDYPPHVWIGTTTENQAMFDLRVPQLKKIPAGCRFISVEPQLGPVSIEKHRFDIDWVICGGESGNKRRPWEVAWGLTLGDECTRWRLPFFMKQDAALREGQQGRIPDSLWKRKEWPTDNPEPPVL